MKHCYSIALTWTCVIVVVSILSCTSAVDTDKYSLEKADEVLAFPIMDEVRVPQAVVFQFDEKGKDSRLWDATLYCVMATPDYSIGMVPIAGE